MFYEIFFFFTKCNPVKPHLTERLRQMIPQLFNVFFKIKFWSWYVHLSAAPCDSLAFSLRVHLHAQSFAQSLFSCSERDVYGQRCPRRLTAAL